VLLLSHAKTRQAYPKSSQSLESTAAGSQTSRPRSRQNCCHSTHVGVDADGGQERGGLAVGAAQAVQCCQLRRHQDGTFMVRAAEVRLERPGIGDIMGRQHSGKGTFRTRYAWPVHVHEVGWGALSAAKRNETQRARHELTQGHACAAGRRGARAAASSAGPGSRGSSRSMKPPSSTAEESATSAHASTPTQLQISMLVQPARASPLYSVSVASHTEDVWMPARSECQLGHP